MNTFLALLVHILFLVLCTQMLAFSVGYNPSTPERRLFAKLHVTAERDLVLLAGNQQVSMPRLGTGTWAWGDKLFWGYNSSQDGSLLQAYNASLSQGVNLFDTAEFYGIGKSELLLGRFNRQTYSESSVKPFFATKFAPLPYRFEKSSVVEACLESRDRLGVSQIDLYQIHWPMPLKNDIYWEGLAECYHKGYVKSVGVSNYGPKLLRSAHSYLKSLGVPLATNQIQYSLLCRTQESNGVLRTAEEIGVTTLAYSPLAQGILTGKFKLSEGSGISKNGLARVFGVVGILGGDRSQLRAEVLPKIQKLLRVMQEIADFRQKSMSQVALNWCICKNTVPIPGARSIFQADQNAGALGWRLGKHHIVVILDRYDLTHTAFVGLFPISLLVEIVIFRVVKYKDAGEIMSLDIAARDSGVNLPLTLQSS